MSAEAAVWPVLAVEYGTRVLLRPDFDEAREVRGCDAFEIRLIGGGGGGGSGSSQSGSSGEVVVVRLHWAELDRLFPLMIAVGRGGSGGVNGGAGGNGEPTLLLSLWAAAGFVRRAGGGVGGPGSPNAYSGKLVEFGRGGNGADGRAQVRGVRAAAMEPGWFSKAGESGE